MSTSGPDLETQKLIARVLTLHFQEGLSQAEIAKGMNLSTAKVNRLIKQGREMGMVEFIIHSPFQRLFELESALKTHWNLSECLVVETVSGNPDVILDLVGKAAANLLESAWPANGRIAITGGKALSAIADNISSKEPSGCEVVPLTGGVQGHHYTDVNHLATRIADKIFGRAHLLHAPLHTDAQDERDLLMSVRSVREVMDKAKSADVAVFGIGSVESDESTYYTAHPLTKDERAELYASGVRAEFLGHLIGESGALCDSALNSRLVSVPLEQAKQIPVRIGVAAGQSKVEPISAVLNGGLITTLVVDETTAKDLLAFSGAGVLEPGE